MNIKLQIGEVVRLIDQRFPIQKISQLITPMAQQARLLYPEPETGVDYLQWTLPGNDWKSYSEASADEGTVVAEAYRKRRNALATALDSSPLKQSLLSIPDKKYIYYRENGTDYDIALVAWGYAYPNQAACTDLTTEYTHIEMQEVKIGFQWEKTLLPSFIFQLAGYQRVTSVDGWFTVDNLLPVGKELTIELSKGRLFTLVVEKGKKEYAFDLTRYFYIDVTVTMDDAPVEQFNCMVTFNGKTYPLTGETGNASLQIPLAGSIEGDMLQSQTACEVSYQDKVQQQTPQYADQRLRFVFSLETIPPDPGPGPKPVPPVPEPPKPQPEPKPEPKPELIGLRLLDYGGYPLADMDFILHTKKKGKVQLRTDAEGYCHIPKDWFTNKEKYKITFDISPEYQQSHDLHDTTPQKK